MYNDYYDLESNDYYFVKGDTVLIKRSFYDEDDNAIDITGYNCKFSVIDPHTGDIIPMITGETTFSKQHNDAETAGEGIYYTGDNALSEVNLTITNTNEIIILLNPADTSLLDAKTYDYDIEFAYNSDVTKFTAVRGKLVVQKEATPSV